jgi:hypothetical protein
MIANRKLPVVKIGDHDYVADFQNSEFRQLGNQTNVIMIHLIPPVAEEGDEITFWYNNRTARVVYNPNGNVVNPQHSRVTLHSRQIDREYFNQRETEADRARSLKLAGKSVYNAPGGIHAWKPIQGILPMVNLYDDPFLLDLQARQFHQVDNPGNVIRWDALEKVGEHFALLYDATNKKEFRGTPEEAIEHGNVKLIALPPLDKMIREGVARHEEKLKDAHSKFLAANEERRKRRGNGI